MPFPDLSSLPVWAQILIYAILGVSIAVAFVVARFGVQQGQRAAPTGAGQATVAAVIVDPTALNAAAASVDGLTVAVTELVVVGRDIAAQMKRAADELDNVREEMRIHREVSRR